jgi:hypothetical protein
VRAAPFVIAGLTRQSILFDGLFAKKMDARVKPVHEQGRAGLRGVWRLIANRQS